MFFCFALIAELRPVPVDPAGNHNISLAFVFIIAVQLLFGWEWSVLTGALGITAAMAVNRVPPIKVMFNACTYAIAAGLAAGVGMLLGDVANRHGYGGVVALTVACGLSFVLANVALVCVAIGLSSEQKVGATIADHLRHSGPIFAIMVFVAAQAVIFWRLSPFLVLLLGAPIFALTLYQRSYVRSRTAEEEAATDALTALKNRRAFEDEAARGLSSLGPGRELSLCLIDIDHFKQVNDRHGHLTGDAMLTLLAEVIAEVVPGRGYRLGGDELAFLVPARGEVALETANRIGELFVQRQTDLVPEPVTVSAGIAVSPGDADELHSLVMHADLALYQSKNNGRSRSTIYVAKERRRHGEQVMGSGFPLLDIRLMTARRLATLVDALATASAEEHGLLPEPVYANVLDHWQSFDGDHSEAVASMAVALGRRLGLSTEELDWIRLAALLHDVGKIAVPSSILSKPGPLSAAERELIERHPMIGFELLRDLGLSPVDTYVLHHHERWDGRGYPHGLAETEIPLGSRLILVADAFDVLTSNRSYRTKVSVDAAMEELQREAGRQLDPIVVAALHDHIAELRQDESSEESTFVPLEAAWSS
jgi:diguanylate cyclase (GGDEF)-like protein/putative nucleotidyltransferase with HDIG domain